MDPYPSSWPEGNEQQRLTRRGPEGAKVPSGLHGNGKPLWSGRPDSNRRHSAWEADALPTELRPRGDLDVSQAAESVKSPRSLVNRQTTEPEPTTLIGPCVVSPGRGPTSDDPDAIDDAFLLRGEVFDPCMQRIEAPSNLVESLLVHGRPGSFEAGVSPRSGGSPPSSASPGSLPWFESDGSGAESVCETSRACPVEVCRS